MKLENWSLTVRTKPFEAPELGTPIIQGNIYNDELQRFEDGVFVKTSRLEELNIKDKYAKTKNSTYILGEVDKNFQNYMKENNYTLNDYLNIINKGVD